MKLATRHDNDSILAECFLTDSPRLWSSIRYVEGPLPNPCGTCVILPSTITPVQRGHTYYLFTEEGSSVHTYYMPCKVMCKETGTFIKGLKSFQNVRPYLRTYQGKLIPRRSSKPTLCIQWFKLSTEDSLEFQKRVANYKGEVLPVTVVLKHFQKELASEVTYLVQLLIDVALFRHESCGVLGNVKIESEEALLREILVLKGLKGNVATYQSYRVSVAKRLTYIKPVPKDIQVLAATVLWNIDRLEKVDFDRMERELRHKRNMFVAATQPPDIPLSKSIERLLEEQPWLSRHIREINGGVQFSVGTTSLVVNPHPEKNDETQDLGDRL